MRSDEEIEGLLEDWLEDTARPIPREVLENTLETVARTSQEGRRASVRSWLARPVGMLAAAALLILVVFAGGLTIDRIGSLLPTPTASGGPNQVWDPAVDFGRWSNHVNPSPDSYGNKGVWSYLSSPVAHLPVVYSPLPAYEDGQWKEPSRVSAYLGQGGILMTPWKGPDNERFAVLGWTSPIAGEVAIRGTFALVQDDCTGSGIDFYVDREPDTLLEKTITTGARDAFDLSTTVGVGDSLYFIIGAGVTSSCDFTLLRLTISHS